MASTLSAAVARFRDRPARDRTAGVTRTIPIDDPTDPRLADYREVRERDLAGRDGFIAEGQVVLEKLVRAGRHGLRSVLLAEKRVAALGGLLAELADDLPVYAASQAVMDAVVGFPIHRGILAAGERRTLDADALLAALPGRALVVGLVGIANHDNMGGLFRNAAAFGADAVLLDDSCCDPLYRKAIRVSVGAVLRTPSAAAASLEALIAGLEAAGFEIVALSPGAAEPLKAVRRQGRQAVLLGSEGPGLPPGVLSRLRSVGVPMAGGFDSLNVAATSALALYQLSESATVTKNSTR